MMCPPSVNTFFIFLRKFTDILACVHTKKKPRLFGYLQNSTPSLVTMKEL